MEDWDAPPVVELVTPEGLKMVPVNGGFLIQVQPVAWAEPLERLRCVLRDRPDREAWLLANWCVEQTIVHVGFHSAGAEVLDKRHYILDSSDAWKVGDDFSGPDVVLRHYLSYVRPKLWLEAKHYYRRGQS